MPRDRRAVIGTAIWNEPTIRALPFAQQHAYLLAYTQPNLNRCGVVPYNLRKWSGMAADLTIRHLRRQFDGLHDSRHVVLDDDHEELFIRTYIGHDGLLAQPLVVAALVRDWTEVTSTRVRRAILGELRRLWDTDRTDAERAGLMLLLGNDPADVGIATDRPAQQERIRGALGRALSVPMREAIAEGLVEPFPKGPPEGFPKGLPEGLTKGSADGPTHTRERDHPPAPPRVSPSPTPVPTPSPTPTPSPRATEAAATDAHTPSPDLAKPDTPDPEDLVAEHLPAGFPRPVRQKLIAATAALLTDGLNPTTVGAALELWTHRPGAGPGLLPYLAADVQLDDLQPKNPTLGVNGSGPPWCQDPTCDEHSRWREGPGGWTRCPVCHPTNAATPHDATPDPAPTVDSPSLVFSPDEPPF